MEATESILGICGAIKTVLSQIAYVKIVFFRQLEYVFALLPVIYYRSLLSTARRRPSTKINYCPDKTDFRYETQKVRIGPVSRGSAAVGAVSQRVCLGIRAGC